MHEIRSLGTDTAALETIHSALARVFATPGDLVSADGFSARVRLLSAEGE